MVAASRRFAPADLTFLPPESLIEATETGVTLHVVIVRPVQIDAHHVATPAYKPPPLFDERVTWEDAEWQ